MMDINNIATQFNIKYIKLGGLLENSLHPTFVSIRLYVLKHILIKCCLSEQHL